MQAPTVQPSFKQMLRQPALFCALGFGAGLVPKAPGTIGTLLAVPVVVLLAQLPYWVLPLVTLIFIVIGIKICGDASKYFGSHDHSSIIWDEIVGYMITLSFVPVNFQTLLLGFVLFRIFDILKPWPISWIDKRVQGGLGIMLDDVAAGLIANVVLNFLFWQNWLFI